MKEYEREAAHLTANKQNVESNFEKKLAESKEDGQLLLIEKKDLNIKIDQLREENQEVSNEFMKA